MFDMTTISLGSHLTSPMSGNSGPIGSLTPSSGMKYFHSSPHANSPMSTPGSMTPNSTISKSNSNSNDGFMDENELFDSKCKRKINFSHLGIPKGTPPATVARRNARERNRVKQVNNGFAALKQHIPLGHRSKKMSKVETLRCAVEYIKNLKGMLDINGALLSTSASSTPSSNSSGNESNDQNHDFGPNGSEFGSDPLGHYHHHHHHQHQHFGNTTTVPAGSHQLSPTSSDDPSSPSYASEASYITTSNKNANNNTNNNNNNNNNMYDFENYEPVSPEDEELLATILSWQQS